MTTRPRKEIRITIEILAESGDTIRKTEALSDVTEGEPDPGFLGDVEVLLEELLEAER